MTDCMIARIAAAQKIADLNDGLDVLARAQFMEGFAGYRANSEVKAIHSNESKMLAFIEAAAKKAYEELKSNKPSELWWKKGNQQLYTSVLDMAYAKGNQFNLNKTTVESLMMSAMYDPDKWESSPNGKGSIFFNAGLSARMKGTLVAPKLAAKGAIHELKMDIFDEAAKDKNRAILEKDQAATIQEETTGAGVGGYDTEGWSDIADAILDNPTEEVSKAYFDLMSQSMSKVLTDNEIDVANRYFSYLFGDNARKHMTTDTAIAEDMGLANTAYLGKIKKKLSDEAVRRLSTGKAGNIQAFLDKIDDARFLDDLRRGRVRGAIKAAAAIATAKKRMAAMRQAATGPRLLAASDYMAELEKASKFTKGENVSLDELPEELQENVKNPPPGVAALTEKLKAKAASSRVAVDLPPDVERYVEEIQEANPDYDESQAWATAWSRYCKYKNPGSEHCSKPASGYFTGKSAKHDRGPMTAPEKKELFEDNPEFADANKNPSPGVLEIMGKTASNGYVGDSLREAIQALSLASGGLSYRLPGGGDPLLLKGTPEYVMGSRAYALIEEARKALGNAHKYLARLDLQFSGSSRLGSDRTAAAWSPPKLDSSLAKAVAKSVDKHWAVQVSSLNDIRAALGKGVMSAMPMRDAVESQAAVKSWMASLQKPELIDFFRKVEKLKNGNAATQYTTTEDAAQALRSATVEARTAASGLYGFTKAAEKSCTGASSKLAKFATKLATDIYTKDADTAAFMAEHTARTGSKLARMLRSEMAKVGPGAPVKTAGRTGNGLYGFKDKTAKLSMEACSELHQEAGRLASDLAGRFGDNQEVGEGFLKKHAKAAKCAFSDLILESYPSSVKLAKAASSDPTVAQILAWDRSVAKRATSFLASDEGADDDGLIADFDVTARTWGGEGYTGHPVHDKLDAKGYNNNSEFNLGPSGKNNSTDRRKYNKNYREKVCPTRSGKCGIPGLLK